MSDFNYTLTLEDIGEKKIDLVNDTINCVLCTAGYTPDQDLDHFLSAIPGGARVATVALSGKSFTGGVFDAADLVFPAVGAGSTVTQAVLYQDQSPTSGARLIRRIAAPNYTGFPFTTNGLDVNLAWPNDANKIFKFVNA